MSEFIDENTPWTSIDLYYKGFHTKKSFPGDYSIEKIKEYIEKAITEGFEPSWNSETSSEHLDETGKWPQVKEVCQHPEDKCEVKISNSEKNKGKRYVRCTLCNSFIRWA